MGQYQFFRIERGGGRSEAVSQSLPDDAEAIRLALSRDYPDGCELWDGFRFMGRFYGPDACRAQAAAQTDELPETAAEAAPGTKPLVH
jgi:hypothetical protein